MSSLQSRVLVAVVGVPVLIGMVFWAPPLAIMFALGILVCVAAYELMNCVGAKKWDFLFMATLICAALTVEAYYSRPAHMEILWTLYVVAACVYAVFKAGEVQFLHVTAGIFAVVVIPYAFSAFLRIEAMGIHRAYLLLPFILSFACDTFAYFAGRAFGKHKLAPKVSPKKTVEGAIGGLAGNMACGLLFALVMDRCFGAGVGYGPMAVLALLCGVAAQVGDLSFSLIKREFGVKDYGRLFLEHGGVLDRFDSVLFVAPAIEIVLTFVQ